MDGGSNPYPATKISKIDKEVLKLGAFLFGLKGSEGTPSVTICTPTF